MSRARAILQSEYPYNINARCINREWFNISMQDVWQIFCEELTRVHRDDNLVIHSFVLMSNHFHLIASTPNSNISACMQKFMGRSSRRLTRAGNRINESFAGRHFKCILQSHNYFLNAYKYNYRNPVTAEICPAVEDYEFSTLYTQVRKMKSPIPVVEDLTYDCDPMGTLKWLNKKPDPSKLEAVRYALKRPYFKSKKCRSHNKPLISEDDLL